MPSYPIDFVAVAPKTERLTLTHRQAAMASNFTLAQTTIHTASQWSLEWSWPDMRPDRAEMVRAWINSLRGQVGTFRYRPRQSVASTLAGRTLSAQGYAYNRAVQIGGWTANAPSQLRLGQYFQIGPQLLEITSAPANADASGLCQIEFEPALRTSYAVGSPVNIINPTGLFRLASSEGMGFTLTTDRVGTFGTMTAVEAVEQ